MSAVGHGGATPGTPGPPVDGRPDPARRAELAHALQLVRDRIAAAARAAGRCPDEITLIAVTKTFPASDVAHLVALGVRDVGENYAQELVAKHAWCREAGLTGPRGPRWHFIGQLQTNKARQVAGLVDVVHSVDRARLVAALGRAVDPGGQPLTCLIQVDVTDPAWSTPPAPVSGPQPEPTGPQRGGAAVDQVPGLADRIASTPGLRLGGVMAVAGRGQPPAQAFARLRAVADRVRADHPEATMISAGMSRDLEAAIDAGATHVRVGAALLGPRPLLR